MIFIEKIFKKNRERIDRKYIDPLTGVYSKEYLPVLEKEFLNIKCSIILLDIDNLDSINRYYGKEIGDLLLSEVVKIIKTSLREEDIIVRIGGDEFLILLKKEGADKNFSYGIGERIIQKIGMANFNLGNQKIKLTASAGIYLEPDKELTLNKAIEKTDKALLLAKQKGKNRIEIYRDSLLEVINKRLIDIKDAIADNRIVCFYQPIFEIESTKTVKFESLVRMVTKDRKIVSPGMFLSQIINTTVYKDLTKRVINYNISIIKQKKINVSVNFLPSDMVDKEFINLLLSIEKPVREKITIELLESENVGSYNILRDNISSLRDAGYKIALDDFGSGFSNLMHVVELKFDYLKIDGNIIRKIDKDHVSYAVVKAIKAFASEIETETVAEFIYSKEIFEKVREVGIKYGQGNYFKEAIPASLIK
ncbi:MAG: bifunctional diguanylate cyclase/phosphodiesterase [Hydrogenothermaceae bacterium]|nr:bifunctional diguanylate cyclase/phosphodiesterase [Hydrogenothermaceae bacterium]